MFDSEMAAASDAALVDVLTDAVRAEAIAAARRFAAIAELTDRRCTSELARARDLWACDGWDSAAAEIAAAQTITDRTASTQMHHGLALTHRLPKVGALLAAGEITAAVATMACWRTHLVEDPELLAGIDTDLAAAITSWGRLSTQRLTNAIDAAVDRHDPAAVLAYQAAARRRDVGTRDDATGTASLWGRLTATDAALLTGRLDAMARSVCREDPRTMGERRSDAIGILAVGGQVLPCRCTDPDCPNTGPDARAKGIVIHVLTDQQPPTGPAPEPTGPADPPSTGPAPTPADPPRAGSAAACPGTAVIAGGAVIPAALLAELRQMGATTTPVPDPHTGMVVAQLAVPPRTAFLRLRAHAFAHDIPLKEVARDVIERRLRFDPDDER